MAAFEPFLPAVQSGAAGSTQSVTLSASSQTIQIPASVSNGESALLCTLVNQNTSAAVIAYIRLSVESSTSITATAADTPMFASTFIPAVKLFASPNMTGAYNIAVICTVAPAQGATIWFTPGSGGVL